MTFSARFFVRGIPKAQPRPRAAVMKTKSGKPHVRMYDAGTAEAWKSDVIRDATPHAPESPIEGPVEVCIDFFMPRPKRLMRRKDPDGEVWFDGKPDRDNLDKAVLDALTGAGWWRDDCQVCTGKVQKVYHPKMGSPGAHVTVCVVDESPASWVIGR